MAHHSKRYRALRDKLKTEDPVPLAEAIKMLKGFGTTKFNQTVEVSTHLGIDPRQSDQNVRGSVALPHGIGKTVRVAVFAQGDNAEKARPRVRTSSAATTWAADQGGVDGLRRGPGHARHDGRRRPPGPRARPPRPDAVAPLGHRHDRHRLGVREFKAGKIEFRNDKGGNVAAPVGKITFSDEQLVENINAFLNYLRTLKPAAAKGTYIQSVTVSATMSPGIRVRPEPPRCGPGRNRHRRDIGTHDHE